MKKAELQILLCFILWGVLPIYWKQLDMVNSVYILASRIVWSLVFVCLIILFQKKWGKVREILHDRKQLGALAGASVLITINWGVYIYAVNSGHIIDSSMAYYLNPILVIIIGAIFFKDKFSKMQKLAIALSAAGVGYSLLAYGQIPYFALIIGGSFALYGAVKKKVKADSEISLFFETAFVFPIAMAVIITMDVQGAGSIGILHGAEYLLIPFAGVITSVPLMIYAMGMKGTSMSMSGILMYINPTLQLLIGVLLYEEQFTMTHAVTFLFIWAAVIIFVTDSLKKNHAK